MTNLISVIIPTYNNAEYLLDAVDSVLNQTYKNVECIIIDDGSTDNTLSLLNQYIHNNLIQYYYQPNKGVSAARNLGIKASKGNYLLFLDADDLLVNDALIFLSSNIEYNDILFGAWNDFTNESNKINLYNNNSSENVLVMYLLHKPTVSTALIKRSCIINWNESFKVWEVTDYFLNLILNNARVKFSNKVVTNIRQHSNPNRATILQDHFDPQQNLSFLKMWKYKIKANYMLSIDVESVIDSEIASNIYTALRLRNRANIFQHYFSEINVKNLINAPSYKKYGLLFFIYHIKTFYSISLFRNLNRCLGR